MHTMCERACTRVHAHMRACVHMRACTQAHFFWVKLHFLVGNLNMRQIPQNYKGRKPRTIILKKLLRSCSSISPPVYLPPRRSASLSFAFASPHLAPLLVCASLPMAAPSCTLHLPFQLCVLLWVAALPT